jgi:septum formation protein
MRKGKAAWYYLRHVIWKNLHNKKIILASQSPRRKELLKGMGISFESCSADLDESYPATLTGPAIPLFLSRLKANHFSPSFAPDKVYITADTIVWLNNRALNKPVDEQEARYMLQSLSGHTHTVYTAVTVSCGSYQASEVDETEVTFGLLSDDEITHYIAHHHPLDKAGAYGVQDFIGYIGIEKLVGSYYNVMGLPTHLLSQMLKAIPQ